MHLKIAHTYKESKFKCEDCEFSGKNELSLEVHHVKCHSEDFECGLCELNFGNVGKLETHLNTCEVYRCRKCYNKETKISEIKAHVHKKHFHPNAATLIDHLKISRNDPNEVSSKEHWHNSL